MITDLKYLNEYLKFCSNCKKELIFPYKISLPFCNFCRHIINNELSNDLINNNKSLIKIVKQQNKTKSLLGKNKIHDCMIKRNIINSLKEAMK